MAITIDEQLEAGPPHAYPQQTARAYRLLERYSVVRAAMRGKTDGPTFNDIEDFLWAFFQNCWHIKEWLRHDCSIDAELRTKAAAAAEVDPDLRVVADMANGSKHFARDEKRERAGAYDGAMVFHDRADGAIVVQHMIAFPNGAHVSAIELDRKAMLAWQKTFKDAGLAYFVDPS